MSKKTLHIRGISVAIITLFILASFTPIIGGYSEQTTQENNQLLEYDNLQQNVLVTCYTFGFPGEPSKEMKLPINDARSLYNKIINLEIEIARDPKSERTQQMQQNIINLADDFSLLPQGTSPQFLKSRFKPILLAQNHRIIINPYQNKATEWLCTFASTGSGTSLPIIILPRFIPILLTPIPRIFLRWNAWDAYTSCGGLRSGTGFIAYGPQTGTALGFWGIGFTFSLPPLMGMYGLIGYALYATVSAEDIEFFPPNNLPIISNENPPDGAYDIPVSLSELSFQLTDADGDLMSYEVTTDPDIGSGSGILKPNGVYTVPISGLEIDKIYRWTIEVNDGRGSIEKEFNFITETLPFDPFNEGWQYRKKVTIEHTQINGDHLYFPVLISTIDNDLRDKAQNGGDDILFMDDTGMATKVYHEIEQFEESTGELLTWVNVPQISETEDTVIYLYYGNPTCNNQQFLERVWNPNFKAVWHLNEIPSGSIYDSTINDNDGTSHGGMSSSDLVDGKVGVCLDFDGDNDYISVPDSSSLRPNDVSLVAWFRPQEEEPINGMFITKACYDYWGNADGRTFAFHWLGLDDTLHGLFERNSDQQHENIGSYPIEINNWYHLVLTFDESSNRGTFYVNGNEEDTQSPLHNSVLWHNSPWGLLIGGCKLYEGGPTVNTWFKCRLDEIRVLDTPLSDEWIATEYNNQNDPSSFVSFGPEEP